MSLRKPLRSLALVTGAFLIVAFVGTFSVTQIRAHVGPVAPGQIHSCVKDERGWLVIVSATQVCHNGWSSLDWSSGSGSDVGSSLVRIETDFIPNPSNSASSKTAVATCPAGKFAYGGGFSISGGGPDVAVRVNAPQFNPPTGWVVTAVEVNPTGALWNLQAFANCAN